MVQNCYLLFFIYKIKTPVKAQVPTMYIMLKINVKFVTLLK